MGTRDRRLERRISTACPNLDGLDWHCTGLSAYASRNRRLTPSSLWEGAENYRAIPTRGEWLYNHRQMTPLDIDFQRRLEGLRSDFQARFGKPFSHFYCPILFRDEQVALCRGHIVNESFPDSARKWIVQREDVDNFYGRAFEGDFVNIQYREKSLTETVLTDPRLSQKLQPKIRIDGQDIEHFVARGPVPSHFTEATVNAPLGPIRLGLKIHPEDAMSSIGRNWQIAIEKDIRVPALVSVLKAAYLTMFDMLGYSYPLSAGGRVIGWDILGKFFENNHRLGKADIVANAPSHFAEFANMVRPLLNPPGDAYGTVSDRFVFVCRCDDNAPWGMIVFVRTSHLVHAALVPILETDRAAERFFAFLRGRGCQIRANKCRFDGDRWYGSKDEEILAWPEADLLGDLDFDATHA